jgi:hypothetical protein
MRAPLDHILNPSSVECEIKQLICISDDWELSLHLTRAHVGVKVGGVIESSAASCSFSVTNGFSV